VYFDGNDISEKVPALAFILGDEGSASNIGKKLVASYLYKKMPEAARIDFYKTYGLDKDAIIDHVYTKPHANVFLASLAPFAKKHIEDPFFFNLVREGFLSFLEIHVQCFPESKNVPVHFVGSVAYHFREVLACAMDELKLKMGRMIQKPLDGLLGYHIQHLEEMVHPLKKSS
jgi:N-acetylglucosamine kinase-like BadF-type ATPase